MGNDSVTRNDRPLTDADVTWHTPRFSAQRPDRPLTYGELWTLTEIENVLVTLSLSETASWIRDLLDDVAATKTTLHACMDALHNAGWPAAPRRSA